MAVLATSSPSASRATAADRLWSAAGVTLAVMPLAMAIASRSAPLVLTIATVLALAAVLVEGEGGAVLRRVGKALATPLGLAVVAFFAWSTVSLGWSEVRQASWRAFVEFWPTVAAAFFLALVLPARMSRLGFRVLAGAIGFGCVEMLIELKTGLALRQSLGVRAWPFIFNRPALTVMATVVPAVVWLAAGKGADSRLLALLLGAVASVLIAVSWSGAAALGLGVILGTALLAWFLPRLAVVGTGLALVAACALAPVQGAIGEKLIPPKVHSELSASHSRERLDVWLAFGGAIQAAPVVGAGFGASARMQDTSAAEAVPPLRRILLEVGHPHDAAMQIWAELGAVGAALAVAILLLVLRGIAALPKAGMVPALALMAGTAIVALVGHGAWQGWWAASVGAAIVWLRAIDHSTEEAP